MTTSTNALTKVPESPAVERLATDLHALLLEPREQYLGRRAAKSKYVVMLRKNIDRRHAKPFDMLLALQFADIDDGAPIAEVVEPYERAIAVLREHAAAKQRKSGLPFEIRFRVQTQRETRAEAKMTAAQFRVADDPSNLDARVELRTASREYRAVLDDLDALLDEGIAATQLEQATA